MADFSVLYQFYDSYNGADFKSFFKFYTEAIKRFSNITPEIVLDVGCGTGVLSKLLSKEYQVIGVDLSPEMLSVAMERCKGKVLLLNQDMRDLELYGTVQGAVSFCDCFNYLSTLEDLQKVFSKIALFMESDGLFVFDASTKYRFEKILHKKAFVNESESGTLIHKGEYSKKDKCLKMNITVFESDGSVYRKYTEEQKEYFYSEKEFTECAKKAGFELCGIFGDMKFSQAKKENEKNYYVFRRKKWEL